MKERIVENLSLFLLKQGYMLKTLDSSFDIMARRGDKVLVLKVLQDANALVPEMIKQMKDIASYLGGVPLIIAASSGARLEDNVVYSRSGVVAFNIETFKNCVLKNYPYLKATNAGFAASLNGERFRMLREEDGMSVNSLARKIGVTPKMVNKYENDNSDVSYSKAVKIYDMFGEGVFNSLNVFARPVRERIEVSCDVSIKYATLGFDVLETSKTPFDMIARQDNELILTSVGDSINKEVVTLSRMLESDRLVVFQNKKPKVDSPIIAKDEFLEFEKAKEIMKFLREF